MIGRPSSRSSSRSLMRCVGGRRGFALLALFLVLGGSLLLAGCRGKVEFVNHDRPALSVDSGIFENAGCVFDEYGIGDCEEGSPLAELGCDRVRKPSDLLGGLEPAYPIAHCDVRPLAHEEGEGEDISQLEEDGSYLYREGCIFPSFARLVLYRDGEFELIKTLEELQSVFAPITGENEALSLALAASGYSAYYDLEQDPELEYQVDRIEGTNVEPISGGYRVRLFHYRLCGCGPHFTYAVDFRISEDGGIERGEPFPVFKDPDEDDLCVD